MNLRFVRDAFDIGDVHAIWANVTGDGARLNMIGIAPLAHDQSDHDGHHDGERYGKDGGIPPGPIAHPGTVGDPR